MGADMDVCSPDRPLEHRPKRLKGIHVNVAPSVFLGSVVNHVMVVPEFAKDAIGHPFIRANRGAERNLVQDRRNKRLAGSVWDNLCEQFTVALKDTHDDGLAFGTASSETLLLTLAPTTHVGFVNLDMVGQRRIAVDGAHIFPDLVRYTEGSRIGNAQLALQFLGRNAMARRGEQVHGVKPFLQRRMRPMKGGSDHGVNVMTAPRAGICGHLANAGEPPALAALRTVQAFAVTKLHQVVEAGVVIRELLHKVYDGQMCGHFSLHSIRKVYH